VYPDEPLRVVMERMATTGLTRFPVVARDDPHRLVGLITISDFLRARQRNLEEERTRERTITLRFPARSRAQRPEPPAAQENGSGPSSDRVAVGSAAKG
ncbi:MAG: CBS domain-containing protein, partial [Chloroflexia bacterium]|nr:CBS domain-containing protein [Chloroflexia bacterium]